MGQVLEGHEKGYDEGRAEVQRLVESLHSIISKAIEKRNEIIERSGDADHQPRSPRSSKKVIKAISENQKNVVINNVVQALRKLKSRGDVVIRVNLSDLELTSEHVKDFMKMVENVKSVTVLEDSSVDRGGCMIETDFGQIDARISSELNEIEERILKSPIRPAKGPGRIWKGFAKYHGRLEDMDPISLQPGHRGPRPSLESHGPRRRSESSARSSSQGWCLAESSACARSSSS